MSIFTRPPAEWTDEDVAGLPAFHTSMLEWFTAYDWRRPKVDPDRLEMSHPQNVVGHQQRTWMVRLALEYLLLRGDVGLELGSAGVRTPFCLNTDGLMGEPSPYSGSPVPGEWKIDGARALPFPTGVFGLVISSHVLEHLEGSPEGILREWLRVVRPGGAVAFIVPDGSHIDVMRDDKTHKWAPCSTSPCPECPSAVPVLPILARLDDVSQVVLYDTLRNGFSFDVVLVKR